MEYVLIGIVAPVLLNAVHMLLGILILLKYDNISSLGFSGISFFTKTIGMFYLTWLGVSVFDLDFRIFVPLLIFFWFITHIIEAFVIQYFLTRKK
tara:strand:- start:643 stop:927 length:285 start_codon:yes stop_codon:yes gene_type:complete